ncbi:MAG TPA: helix-turn-helix transcriptional regulator [Flavisolibacter sp.]|jgi:AraC-like DNA-binding protein|nr:helix-turn-helix transcriptional regulator [Flavisolibacter sp.]
MPSKTLHSFHSIAEYHRFRGLPAPAHPLISVIDMASLPTVKGEGEVNLVFDFYSIALKRMLNAKMKYGQQQYDFDEGVLFFMAPGQIFGIEVEKDKVLEHSGWMILIHPNFLWNTSLAGTIRQYDYFNYSVHEALFLSELEEATLLRLIGTIHQEHLNNIDRFTQDILIAQLELLLSYADRYYHRQFLTRKITNHQVLSQLETLLTDWFNSPDLTTKGLPTVQSVAEALHLSPTYLSSLLKVLTGQTTQQHIHNKLLEKAKQILSTTQLSVSEIAYELGFEHPQSFSKLFKAKTQLSPLKFRQSFN